VSHPDPAVADAAHADVDAVPVGVALPAIDDALGQVANAKKSLTAAAERLAESIRGAPRPAAPIRDADEADAVAERTRERILADPHVPARFQGDVEPGHTLSLLV
jgi:hypothetical protein